MCCEAMFERKFTRKNFLFWGKMLYSGFEMTLHSIKLGLIKVVFILRCQIISQISSCSVVLKVVK